MKTKTIDVCGFKVDIWDFGYAKFMYPQFNGNAEFRVNKQGYKKMRSWLRTIIYFEKLEAQS